jgi:translocation and assembly module TamA
VTKFLPRACLILVLSFLLPVGALWGDELEIVITGVEEPILGNVRSMVQPFRLMAHSRLSRRRLEKMRLTAEHNAFRALRPFGYYHPEIVSRVVPAGERAWRFELDIKPGPPVVVTQVQLELRGPGAELPELLAWRKGWPLTVGSRLVQPDWDRELQRALDLAADRGYLMAEFLTRSIELDLERNEARLELLLDTGERAVMGEVRFHQDSVAPYILENLPRFDAGDPYDAWMLERFRIDLWRTGYFSTTDVREDRDLEATPPRVDLDVFAEPRKPNTYQGSIGIGSDTGARVQFSWNRHRVSSRGDSFSLATGWQDHNNEYYVRGAYRIPRDVRTRQFWIANALLKRENEDIKVSDEFTDEDLFSLGNADIDDYSLRLGRLRVRDLRQGYRQLFETVFVQALRERIDYGGLFNGVVPTSDPLLREASDLPLERYDSSLSLGIEYEMPYIRGNGFDTVGLNNRGWAFVSSTSWGSDRDFAQVYLSSRWNVRVGERWKFLLRGEVGYTDADVERVSLDIDDRRLNLSVTQLPNLYRFKAGGSSSVRGYGFERLSDNNIGSNNIVTASAEVEMKVVENWSVAAFVDVGNAFNDWDAMELKAGAGVGVRWYTIAGAVKVDFAQGFDLAGDPWRIHFTIGTSLL